MRSSAVALKVSGIADILGFAWSNIEKSALLAFAFPSNTQLMPLLFPESLGSQDQKMKDQHLLHPTFLSRMEMNRVQENQFRIGNTESKRIGPESIPKKAAKI